MRSRADAAPAHRLALRLIGGLAAALALGSVLVPPGKAAAPPLPPELAPIPIAMLVEMGSGQVLAARDPARAFLPASVTKVMTEYVAFEEIAAGRLDPRRSFVVDPATARQWAGQGTSLALRAGTRIDADTLLHAIATVSANDAAVVLAKGYAGSIPAWTAMMNRTAHKLGMRDSAFATPNGWPDEGRTRVSARDLVTLASAMIARYPRLYHTYFGQRYMTYDGLRQHSHDPTLGLVEGADGIKTGHTNEAGYNFLGSATRGGRRLVMVIAGAAYGRERAAASRALLEWGFSAWRARPLFAEGQVVASAQVQGGAARSVPLVASHAVDAAMAAGTTQPVALTLRYRGPIVAPIAKGAEVAELEIDVLGMPPARVPLYAANAVGVAGPLDRIGNGLASLIG